MLREHSGSISQQRKNTGGRRVSASAAQGHTNSDSHDSDARESTVRDLTAKLDKMNVQIDATNGDLKKEDEEFQTQQALLETAKNELKQAVTDKEGASKSLKKQVADLGGQNSLAQGKRATAEKRLQAKQQDREKLREEIRRWDLEIAAFQTEAGRLAEEKVHLREEVDEEISILRGQLSKETSTNKKMEDELRRTRREIKDLEHETERLGQEETDDFQGPAAFSQREYGDWPQKLHSLQMNYNAAFQKLEAARIFAQQAQGKLEEWEARRAAQPEYFLAATTMDLGPPRRNSNNRRSRALSQRMDMSPQNHGYDHSSAPPPYSSTMATVSPPFASVSPFFNMMNGAPMASHHMSSMSPAEIEQLTAGAPQSPMVAGELLPAGLFHDDEPSRLESFDSSSSNPSLMAANALPGLGAPQTQHAHRDRDPVSPISNTSRSPSLFQSPRESNTHLPFRPASGREFDSDRRSVRSNTSSLQHLGQVTNGTTRFANLFGFNRQRGKTTSDEGPPLGSLRSAESQSFPRQDMAEGSSTASRRRGSHSGGDWIKNPFSRGGGGKELPTDAQPSRRRFGVFGAKVGDVPDSPRPGSTASSENTQLPKPSADSSSRFGWNMPGDPFGPRHSPLGADWGMSARNDWSRHPSRRPSIQYPPGHNFMDESFPDDDSELGPPRRRSPKLAPIGTRPASQISTSSANTPRLNPAAPAFKALFTRERRGEKTERGKGKKESPKDKEIEIPALLEPASPYPASTYSHDFSISDRQEAPSISTADTTSEGRNSLELTPSRASEATPKETFMQKLTRKSSASMFNFPGFGSKEKVARLSAKKAQQVAVSVSTNGGPEYGTPDETDEEGSVPVTSKKGDLSGSTGLLSASLTSEGGKGGGSPMLGAGGKEKFSFRRSLTGRRKGEKAASLHESVASDLTGDDEELEEGEIRE